MRPVLLLALALGAAVARAQTVASPEAPAAATLDAIVEDAHGRRIDTLGKSDFVAIEQGAALTIESVRFVRATGVRDGPAPAAASASGDHAAVQDTTRLFAIFLDEFHVSRTPETERARAALVHFVRNDLGPDDLLVVHKPLDSLRGIRLTRDREAVAGAIESFEPRRGDYSPRTALERELIAGLPPRADSARAQVAASALEALVAYLGRFSPERKTLIVLSEGFPSRGGGRTSALLPGTRSTVLAANRAHVSIYAVDPRDDRGPVATQAASTGTSSQGSRVRIQTLAEQTGGRHVSLADGNAFRRLMSDASGYYVLTVAQRGQARDGRFHPVAVSVRRPDLTVRARAGYVSLEDEETVVPALSMTSSKFSSVSSASFAAGFVRRTSPLIRPWFGQSRAADGATRVNFVWEPVPPVPGERRPPPAPARIVLAVTTLDGRPVFEGVVLPSNAQRSAAPGVPQSMASFEIPAGQLLVRMNIEDVASRVLDRDVRDLAATGFTGPVTMGSAEVLRARTAREFETLADDPDPVPVASRQFSRMERLLVRLPLSAPSGTPALSARLVSGLGGSMRTLTVSPSPSARAPFQVDVPLAGLATGAYTLEVVARTSDGEAREDLRFLVTP